MSTTIRCSKELTHALKNRGEFGNTYEEVIWDYLLMDVVRKLESFVRDYHTNNSLLFSTKNKMIQVDVKDDPHDIHMPLIQKQEEIKLIYTPEHIIEKTLKPMLDKIIGVENKLLNKMSPEDVIYMECPMTMLVYTSMNKEHFVALRTCFNTTATPTIEQVVEITTNL